MMCGGKPQIRRTDPWVTTMLSEGIGMGTRKGTMTFWNGRHNQLCGAIVCVEFATSLLFRRLVDFLGFSCKITQVYNEQGSATARCASQPTILLGWARAWGWPGASNQTLSWSVAVRTRCRPLPRTSSLLFHRVWAIVWLCFHLNLNSVWRLCTSDWSQAELQKVQQEMGWQICFRKIQARGEVKGPLWRHTQMRVDNVKSCGAPFQNVYFPRRATPDKMGSSSRSRTC